MLTGWTEELENAHAIQQHLLARDGSLAANADCSAICRQANAVGGDFYDLQRLPNGQLGIAIGDVAGKGIGAALLMANLQATLRAEARRVPPNPAATISSVNDLFHEVSFDAGYATLFYAAFDPATRLLKYVNAGHNPPLVRRADGSIEWLETGGAPVGMFQSWEYQEGCVMLNPGDVLVAYTDGIVEAQDVARDDFGVGRLVEATSAATASEISAEIWESVDRFAAGTKQRDDMTLLVLEMW